MNAQALVGEIIVPCSSARATEALARYVRGVPRIAVRPRCALPRLLAEIEALHDVIVDFTPVTEGRVAVSWHGAGESPFPGFAGTLRVVAEDERARIRLEGHFEDPGPNARDPQSGLTFRLAQAACRSTLSSIARGILAVH